MSEEKKPSPAPENSTAESGGQDVGKTAGQRKSERSVFRYIGVLFAAAFLLLLFTFVMEMRQHQAIVDENQEQIEDLNKQSISAVQSLNDMVAENERLKKQQEEMERQLQEQSQENAGLKEKTEQQEKALQAMDWFWQIDEAYVKGSYRLCRSLIEQLEEAGLVEHLPRESITDNERFSPYDRFQEIKDRMD